MYRGKTLYVYVQEEEKRVKNERFSCMYWGAPLYIQQAASPVFKGKIEVFVCKCKNGVNS